MGRILSTNISNKYARSANIPKCKVNTCINILQSSNTTEGNGEDYYKSVDWQVHLHHSKRHNHRTHSTDHGLCTNVKIHNSPPVLPSNSLKAVTQYIAYKLKYICQPDAHAVNVMSNGSISKIHERNASL